MDGTGPGAIPLRRLAVAVRSGSLARATQGGWRIFHSCSAPATASLPA